LSCHKQTEINSEEWAAYPEDTSLYTAGIHAKIFSTLSNQRAIYEAGKEEKEKK
jgi:hypothetical protein